MKSSLLLFQLMGLVLFSTLVCGRQQQVVQAGPVDPNLEWKQFVNSKQDALQTLYTANAVKITEQGKMIHGVKAIAEQHKQQARQIEAITTQKRITAVLDSTIIYEIGKFNTTDNKVYAHFIIWRKENGNLLRELEFIAEENSDNSVTELKLLDERRKEWMKLCNNHNAGILVRELYTENTLYYNHKPMVKGREAVAMEYQYMNSSGYQLALEPITVHPVNNSLAFEIGQCKGSYPGNYVLVWKKDTDGIWRILLDSNI